LDELAHFLGGALKCRVQIIAWKKR
jgi:hypothetical protein